MKLVTYQPPGSTARPGLVVGSGVIDLARHVPAAAAGMIELITQWPAVRATVQALVRVPADHALADVTLLAPVPRPGKIMAIGLNYADHVREAGHAMPTEQIWFSKAATAANAPYAGIELPIVSSELDFEAELAFVIGRRCRHVSRADAAQVIFGYCAANDVSVRDWQRRTSQYILGKSFDTHAPFGPWLCTADEVGDPHQLGVRCFVNGEKQQDSNTRELVFNCFDQIAHLSKVMTLEPGDLILTGTPGGVGAARKPPLWLKAGDVVRVEIDRIGAIENRVVPEQPPVPPGF